MKRSTINAMLAACASVYGQRFTLPSAEREHAYVVEVWHSALKDIDDEDGKRAFLEHIKTAEWPPTPADIRRLALVEPLGLPSAEEAWCEVARAIRDVGVYGTPRWSCPEVAAAVDGIGWERLCSSEQPDLVRAHFLRTYTAIVQRTARRVQVGEGVAALSGRVVKQIEGVRDEQG